MANGRRNYKRNGRKNGKKKVYKNRRKMVNLNDPKLKALVRKEARQLDSQSKKTLVQRCFWGGQYRLNDNRWAGLVALSRTGQVVRLHMIAKSDIANPVNVAFANDPFSISAIGWDGMPMPNQDDAGGNTAGANRGMVTTTSHGFREKEFIVVKALSVYFHVKVPGYAVNMIPTDYQNITINWGLYTATTAEDLILNANFIPPVDRLTIRQSDGYSSLLDIEKTTYRDHMNSRCIKKGKFTIKIGQAGQINVPITREYRQYIKFPNNFKIEYEPLDQQGLQVRKNPLYLVLYSNQLATEPNALLASVGLITKVYYYDQ